MKDINNFFLVYCVTGIVRCPENFTERKYLLKDLKKQSFLRPLVIKKVTQFSGFLPTSVSYLKSGLYISPKDLKHMLANMFLRYPPEPWSSYHCNNRRYSYFARNICNRYVDTSLERDCKYVLQLLTPYIGLMRSRFLL